MKSRTGELVQFSLELNERSARLLALATAISALLVWSGLKSAQELFPNIPTGVTIQVLLASLLTSLTLGSLVNQSIRKSLLRFLARYSQWIRLEPMDAFLITMAPFLSLAAWTAAGITRQILFPTLTAVLWVAAILAAAKVGFRRQEAQSKWSTVELGSLAVITLAALLIRGLQLDSIPWLLTGDEGSIGLSSLEFAEGSWNSPFYIAWNSFPSLFFVLPAAFIKILGNTTTALRLHAAIAGALTVFALYGYARRAFGKIPAFLASVLLAAFHFHIHFSRLGLNNIWDGFFYVVVAGSLWRAWVRNNTYQFVWPGIAIGFSFYFYTTSRFIPLLVIAWVVLATLKDRSTVRQRAPGLMVMILAGLAVALPLMAFFAHHPQEFLAPFSRVGQLGDWLANESIRTDSSAIALILDKIRLSSLAFFSVDLRMWYLPETPMLLPLASTLFGLGAIIVLLKSLDLRYSFLLFWVLIGIFSGAASDSTPAAQRYVFVAPAVMLFISLALTEGLHLIRLAWPGQPLVGYGLVGILLLIIISGDLIFYFGEFSAQRKFGDLNTETANVLAEYLQEIPPGVDAYFLAGRMGFYSHSTVPYLAPHIDGHEVLEPISEYDSIEESDDLLFLALPERGAEMEFIQSEYPGGHLRSHKGQQDRILFISYNLGS